MPSRTTHRVAAAAVPRRARRCGLWRQEGHDCRKCPSVTVQRGGGSPRSRSQGRSRGRSTGRGRGRRGRAVATATNATNNDEVVVVAPPPPPPPVALPRRSRRISQEVFHLAEQVVTLVDRMTQLHGQNEVNQQLIELVNMYYLNLQLDQLHLEEGWEGTAAAAAATQSRPLTLPEIVRRNHINVTVVNADSLGCDEECDVCMETTNDNRWLKFGCGHGMCRTCTTSHLKTKNTCHMCRRPIQTINTVRAI